MFRRSFFVCLAAALLSACAAPNIDKDFKLEKAASSGIACGSITYQGGYASFRLHLEKLGSGETFKIEHGNSQTLNPMLAFKGEPINPALKQTGSVFAVELPNGRYVLKSWQIGQGMAQVWSTGPTGVEFEVKAGEAIYLGNFHFRGSANFGRLLTSGALTLKDQSERDLPAIRAEFDALKASPLTQALAVGANFQNVGGASDGKVTIPIFVPVVR